MSQLARFGRLLFFGLVPTVISIATDQSKLTVAGAIALFVAAAETAWRKVYPAIPAPKALPPAKP